jgi:hypothetical protein
MNRPFNPIKARSAAPASMPTVAVPVHPLSGAAAEAIDAPLPCVSSPTGEAGASNLSNYCRHCDGAGEVEILALDAVRPVVELCHACEGSGRSDPRCETCEGPLAPDGFCFDCDDLDSRFVLVERIAPGRIAV